MGSRRLLAIAVLVLAGCAPQRQAVTVDRIAFLTRDGCADSETMRRNLDQALSALRARTDYQVLDVATLPASDARRGYPTPTVLYDNRDLFGMPEPQPPIPGPT